MSDSIKSYPSWLSDFVQGQKISLWGAADLRGLSTPKDDTGESFPFAISWAVPMNPQVMFSIRNGPNREYANEYFNANVFINNLAEKLTTEIISKGFRAQPLAASGRTDIVKIKGDFPHKTAATRAGLGWIGRHCQLITRSYGPWVRLGTVFTDMPLQCGKPAERSFCGRCTSCIDACPADALSGKDWHPGLEREEILDVHACDLWKKERYTKFSAGHNCGICTSVCPYGLKFFKKNMPDRL